MGTADPSPASVAVVLVDWNAGGLITACLEALARQTLAPRTVVVVDNASDPPTWRHLRAAPERVEMIRLPRNLGFAAGVNRGVALVESVEWIALLNPDAFPRPDWLERLVAAASRNPDYDFFASRQVSAEAPERLDGTGDVYTVSGLAWRRDHGEKEAGRRMEEGEVFGPCAAAALYRRKAFVEAGGLDESFFCYFEDVDLAFRLRLAGHRCLYVPDAVVRHVGSASSGRRSAFTVYHGHRNLVWTFFKNMPSSMLARYWPHHMLLNALSIAHLAARGQGGPIVRAKRDAFIALPRVMRQRRRVQRTRRASAAELRRAMVGGLEAFGVRRLSPHVASPE